MSLREALKAGAAALAAVADDPRYEAELLLAHTLGVERSALLLSPPEEVPEQFAELIARRAAGEPLAYVLGHADFWTIRLAVGRGALIPRSDSETLLRAVLEERPGWAPRRILDLGTGPGTLLFAALDQWRAASGVGLERSAEARSWAEENRVALNLTERASIVAGDWKDRAALAALGRFDLILANPPYIAEGDPDAAPSLIHEPAAALWAGTDGLDDYRVILPALPQLLAEDGIAAVEIGHRQAASVRAIAVEARLTVLRVAQDFGGRDRALLLAR